MTMIFDSMQETDSASLDSLSRDVDRVYALPACTHAGRSGVLKCFCWELLAVAGYRIRSLTESELTDMAAIPPM